MMKYEVRSIGEAMAYLVDCELATVSHVIGKKSSTKTDIQRHIRIAKTGIDWMIQFGVELKTTRALEVVKNHGGKVADWAEKYKA